MTEWIYQSGDGWLLARLSEASGVAGCLTLLEGLDHRLTNDTFATGKIKGCVRASAAGPPVDFLSIANELQGEINLRSLGLEGPHTERFLEFHHRDLMEVRLLGLYRDLQIPQLKGVFFYWQ